MTKPRQLGMSNKDLENLGTHSRSIRSGKALDMYPWGIVPIIDVHTRRVLRERQCRGPNRITTKRKVGG